MYALDGDGLSYDGALPPPFGYHPGCAVEEQAVARSQRFRRGCSVCLPSHSLVAQNPPKAPGISKDEQVGGHSNHTVSQVRELRPLARGARKMRFAARERSRRAVRGPQSSRTPRSARELKTLHSFPSAWTLPRPGDLEHPSRRAIVPLDLQDAELLDREILAIVPSVPEALNSYASLGRSSAEMR